MKIKKTCLFFAILFLLNGCGKKEEKTQDILLYAASDYAVCTHEDGTIEYLYQQADTEYPDFTAYTCVGIIEDWQYPGIITEDGQFISSDNMTADELEKEFAESIKRGEPVSEGVSALAEIRKSVESWTELDIAQMISDSGCWYAARMQDGTVVSVGLFGAEQVNENWADITQIVASAGELYGLRNDGTICVRYANGDVLDEKRIKEKLAEWKDIVEITGGPDLFGLKKDGTVLATATNFSAYKEWTDVTAIAASRYALVGIRQDGTVVAECREMSGFKEDELTNWKDIVQIAVCDDYCIGIRQDGTVVKTGEDSI